MFHKSNTKNLKEGTKFFKLDDLKCVWKYREIRKNENTDYQIYKVHKKIGKLRCSRKEKLNKQCKLRQTVAQIRIYQVEEIYRSIKFQVRLWLIWSMHP